MIGGTDISAIVGMNPYKSAFDVYLKCIGESIEIPDNPAMKWGRILESVVSAEYQRAHQEFIVVPHEVVIHQALPYVKGSPDRVCRRNCQIEKGLEIKTASEYSKHMWGESGSDTIPEHYRLQVAWYQGLMNGMQWDLAALIGGNDYREYSFAYDAELWNLLLECATKFWRDHVEKRSPPDIENTDSTALYIKRKYSRPSLPLRSATDDEYLLINEYMRKKSDADELDNEIETLKLKIQSAIGDSEGVEFEGGKATWKTQKASEYTVKKEEQRVLRISKKERSK